MNEWPATEEEIERARRAIMDAPKTESGIIIPPHVAAQQRDGVVEAPREPNRAERRWQAKQERRRQREQARQARMKPEAREAVNDAEAAFRALPDELQPAALGMVKTLAGLPREEQERLLREMGGDDAA